MDRLSVSGMGTFSPGHTLPPTFTARSSLTTKTLMAAVAVFDGPGCLTSHSNSFSMLEVAVRRTSSNISSICSACGDVFNGANIKWSMHRRTAQTVSRSCVLVMKPDSSVGRCISRRMLIVSPCPTGLAHVDKDERGQLHYVFIKKTAMNAISRVTAVHIRGL